MLWYSNCPNIIVINSHPFMVLAVFPFCVKIKYYISLTKFNILDLLKALAQHSNSIKEKIVMVEGKNVFYLGHNEEIC